MRYGLTLALLLACVAPVAGQHTTPPAGDSQAPSQLVVLDELVLTDGSRLYGEVAAEREEEIDFVTHAGARLTVPRGNILRMRKSRGTIRGGQFWRADPNRTRLFFAPTGETLEQGSVSVGVYAFVMPFVQVGLTDRISIGGGTPLLFGLYDWDRPFWVTPKIQVYRGESLRASVGTMHVFDGSGDGGGIAYAVGTWQRRTGSRLTVGVGRTYTGFRGGGNVLMVGGDAQVGRSVKLVTENYVWSGGDGIFSGGVRLFGERFSTDLLMVGATWTNADITVFPMLSFAYVF